MLFSIKISRISALFNYKWHLNIYEHDKKFYNIGAISKFWFTFWFFSGKTYFMIWQNRKRNRTLVNCNLLEIYGKPKQVSIQLPYFKRAAISSFTYLLFLNSKTKEFRKQSSQPFRYHIARDHRHAVITTSNIKLRARFYKYRCR